MERFCGGVKSEKRRVKSKLKQYNNNKMKKEKEFKIEGLRIRTPEVIEEERLFKKFESMIVWETDESGYSHLTILAFVNKAPAAKKVAPKKKAAKKTKKEAEPDVKVLSAKEMAKITKETKAAYAVLTTLPAPPWKKIITALQLGKLNPKELCSYFYDVYPRVTAITELTDCVPSMASLKLIADALTPLANLPSIKISSSDKEQRDTYHGQLSDGLYANCASCVNLADGNLPLFNLTTYRLKNAPVYFKGQLPAQNFVLGTNKGPGKIRVKTKKNKYAKSYTVYYGVGDYDPETWSFKVGGPDQIISGTPGQMTNFIIVANTDIEGVWPDPQSKRFPFN